MNAGREILRCIMINYVDHEQHLRPAIVSFWMCTLYNQRDATYTMFFIIISALHISGGLSAHHQELIKLYVQPWVLSYFPTVYRCCAHTVL